jgi:YgiT-type zinc finger domain-containing protein
VDWIPQTEKEMICRKCLWQGRVQVETEARTITQTYRREGSNVEVTVDNIPAQVCLVCGEVYIDDDFLAPLLEFGRRKHLLEAPRVRVELEPVGPDVAYSHLTALP